MNAVKSANLVIVKENSEIIILQRAIFNSSYQCRAKKIMFSGQMFEIDFLFFLCVLMFPESKT